METEHDEEESLETESYSPQKPSTAKSASYPEMCPKCNTTTTDMPLALWVRGKRIPTEELPKFYNQTGVVYPSDYLPSLPEISTKE